MNLDKYVLKWLRECSRSDKKEVASVGFKSSGLEYKIMTGTLGTHGCLHHDDLSIESQITDRAFAILLKEGNDMNVLKTWYRNGKKVRTTADLLHRSRHNVREQLKRELPLLEGTLLALLSK